RRSHFCYRRPRSVARIVIRELHAQRLVGRALLVADRGGYADRQLHQLVARMRARDAAPLQAQLAPRLRAGRNAQLHRAGQGRHRHRGAQRRFPRADRQHVQHVVAFQLEAGVVADAHFQQQVAFRAAVAAGMALPRQPDHLSRLDAGGNLHLQHALLAAAIVQGQPGAPPVERGLQVDLHPRLHVLSASRAWLAALLAMTAGGAAEQALEEIAEVAAALAEVEMLALSLAPARRRPELLAAAVAAGAQLVVGAALLGVQQHLLRLVGGLELLLGARFLVLVRVILARQLAIGGLDLRLAGLGLHAQDLVIVFEFHRHSLRQAAERPHHAKRPTADHRPPRAAPASRRRGQWAVSITMRRGALSAFFGITISSTPCRLLAVMCSASTLSGSAKRRWNGPCDRSCREKRPDASAGSAARSPLIDSTLRSMFTSIAAGSTPGTSARMTKRPSSSRMSTRGAHDAVPVGWLPSDSAKRSNAWRNACASRGRPHIT